MKTDMRATLRGSGRRASVDSPSGGVAPAAYCQAVIPHSRMACYLRVELPEGAQALARQLSIEPYVMREKGQQIPQRPGHTYDRAYLSFDVSEADFDQLPQQFDDAVDFLRAHKEDIRRITEAGEACLDFGHSPRRATPDFTPLVQVNRIPQGLIRLAADLDLEIELSLYLGWEDEEEIDPEHRAI